MAPSLSCLLHGSLFSFQGHSLPFVYGCLYFISSTGLVLRPARRMGASDWMPLGSPANTSPLSMKISRVLSLAFQVFHQKHHPCSGPSSLLYCALDVPWARQQPSHEVPLASWQRTMFSFFPGLGSAPWAPWHSGPPKFYLSTLGTSPATRLFSVCLS